MSIREVTLRNTRRQPFLATMFHDVVCRRADRCQCAISYRVGPKGKRLSTKSPASFQVDALSKLTVIDAVLHLPQVKAAMAGSDPWLVRVEPAAKVIITPVVDEAVMVVTKKGRK